MPQNGRRALRAASGSWEGAGTWVRRYALRRADTGASFTETKLLLYSYSKFYIHLVGEYPNSVIPVGQMVKLVQGYPT